MELRYMQSPSVSSIPRRGLFEKPFLHGDTIVKLPSNKRTFRNGRRLNFLDFGTQALVNFLSLELKHQAKDATPNDGGAKDRNLVFVAGATGKVGSRTVRELLKVGFSVRAGVRSIQRAESLVQSVQKMKLEDVEGGTKPIDKLELVECDLEKPYLIGPALANSSIVICCIGASEKEILDITGPYRIDYVATKNLIDAATSAKVEHFILLTSLGTNKVGWPAAILNLFWGVLCWKRKAEEALLASGLPYTIVRPGGMERPTDSYKETHNVTLSEEDTLFGGQVSNLQVAELMAFMAKNRSLSYCKVVEVIAETSAPLSPTGDLLKKIPSQRKEIYPFKESDGADEPKTVVQDRTITEKEPEQIKTTVATPLSPYIAYEDLKPPTSPTPTPSTGSSATKASNIDTTPTRTSSSSSSVEVISLEKPSIAEENVAPQIAPKRTNALSPYINYEDLKPPTSPTPTPSSGSVATKAINIDITPVETSSTSSSVEVNSLEKPSNSPENVVPPQKRKSALSPYINYEDLKPPTSPTPIPSGSKKEPSVSPGSIEVTSELTGENNGASGTASPDKALASNHSPFLAYDELKPPSSPSPSVPIVSGNNKPENPVDEKPVNVEHHIQSKATPLSPFTMYEDLKPPSSPAPSPRKL
ncbi:hypothetical protein BUALT_Bualt15G0028900 [Buddleja alternifolia]|uniref:NAD(P)-binding domain-containing protein n=1 Tax=Buddleja alternifolia TaxID=168488 RepID=A0AAV6WJV9_9LAMI|nr:hypothetical protein BUALT_Bualt15G0028900 [Buddleja alternifolia]